MELRRRSPKKEDSRKDAKIGAKNSHKRNHNSSGFGCPSDRTENSVPVFFGTGRGVRYSALRTPHFALGISGARPLARSPSLFMNIVDIVVAFEERTIYLSSELDLTGVHENSQLAPERQMRLQ